jgi:hypothetical protein
MATLQNDNSYYLHSYTNTENQVRQEKNEKNFRFRKEKKKQEKILIFTD